MVDHSFGTIAARPVPTVLFLFLLAAAAVHLHGSSAQGLPPDLSQHPPIHIDGDAGFLLPGSGVTGGLGTEDDPFVISGWTIRPEYRIGPVDMSDDEAGIRIENTRMHYRIQNVIIESGFRFGIQLDGSGGHGHVADTTIVGAPEELRFGVWAGSLHEGAPELHLERVNIQIQPGMTPIIIQDSPSVLMDQVVVTSTDGSGSDGGIFVDGAQDVDLRNIHLDHSYRGLSIAGNAVHLQGINIINASYEHLTVDAANVTAQDVTVISSSWTRRDIISIKASGDVRLQGVQANGNVRVDSGGGLVVMENLLASAPPAGSLLGGIMVQGVGDLVASGVEVYGFNRLGGLWVEGSDQGHWSLDSVHIEVEDARLDIHGGATVEADGIIVRGGNIDINGSGEYELRDVLVEGGGIKARGAGIDLSIQDAVLRAGNRIDGYGAGIWMLGDADRPDGSFVLKNTLVQHNIAQILSIGGVRSVNVTSNTFEDNIDGIAGVSDSCAFRVEGNTFTTESTWGGFTISDTRDLSGPCGAEASAVRRIAGNTFEGADIGLLASASHLEIRNNTFTDQAWHGMKFHALTDSIVADNTITGAGTSGIRAWAEGPNGTVLDDIARNTFTGNRITGTTGEFDDISGGAGGEGMVLAGIENAVEGNWFEDNAGYGLVVTRQGNHVDGNSFSGNGKGEIAHKLDPGKENGTRQDTPMPREHEAPAPGLAVIAAMAAAVLSVQRRHRRP